VAKVLGLSVSELQTQMKSGKTLADIAKAQNVDIAKVKEALVAGFTAHLDAEVKAGEHTQAEADAKLARFTSNLDNIVNGVRPAGAPGMNGKDGDHGPRGGAPFATDGLAKVLGLSITNLQTQVQSGKTLADIAKAQNVDITQVKDQLLKDFTEKEQAEVKAGEHTQAEVDAKIAAFTSNLDNMVNGVRPEGAPGMGGHGDHRGGRHGHGPMGDHDNEGQSASFSA
jgi:DNA-directed RNA polymerase specialized sigma subunit